MKAVIFFLTVLLASTASSWGQGLLGIGQKSDYKENTPLTVNAKALYGYDHMSYAADSASNVNSSFIEGAIGLSFAESDRITKITSGADFGTIYYFDKADNGKQTYYNARATFNIEHQVSRRLSLSDNFYAAYEIEPDFNIGVSSARRSGQYFYGYNNFAVSYAWSQRFATTTAYTISGIKYQDSKQGALEDRISNIASQQFNYKLSRTTALTAEYRYEKTNYTNYPGNRTSPDYTAHYLLVGVDQAWSPRLSASARAGVEFYDSDRTEDTAPYVEASINYALSRLTGLRWYHQLGYDGSQLGDYNSRYSYRTGIVATHQFTEKLSGNAGVHYVYSDYKGGESKGPAKENEVNAGVGVNYKITKNLAVQANYSFTTISSDISFNEYDRHYTTVGLNASF